MTLTQKLRLPVAAIALATAAVAHAAPVQGPADNTFYDYPTSLPGNHGDLISYRPAVAKLGPGAPEVNAWNVVYQSKDSLDFDFAVSGTVFVPKTAWTGTGPRPVILYAVGTHGLASDCAPSRQFAKGSDYENANIAAALKKGYAVLVTDYDGALNGIPSTYLAGKSQGQATIDIFKAATSIPGAGISGSAPVAIWGYSQGGQTAAWAAEVLPTYAPGMKVVGVAAGGIPGDFIKTAYNLNDNAGFAFLAAAIVGLGNQYPGQIPIELIANEKGKQELANISKLCVFKALFQYQNENISDYTMGSQSLDALLAIDPVRQTLLAQTLGTRKLTVPMYQYHGRADEFIPLDQAIALKKSYCAKASNVTFDLYPSEHIVTQFQAAPTVLSWLDDRFAGKAAQGTCSTTAPEPKTNANPGGGDLVVTLDKWKLAATVGLKTLNQTVTMPADSTFTADANVTAKTLNGNLNIPDFKQQIKIIGLPVNVGLKISSAGPTTGSVSLDDEGILRVSGSAPVNITVSSVLGIPFGECKTVTPVNFPLNFTGPISSLGNGGLTFTGTVTFPQIKGCFISAILSTLMSGSGQTYTFTVSPPAPVKY